MKVYNQYETRPSDVNESYEVKYWGPKEGTLYKE